MRRALFVLVLAAAAYCPSAIACGDKFLVIGRGASYRGRYVAIHPANILLYGEKAAGNGDVDVRHILQRAGHHVDYAADDARLGNALGAKNYDIVIAPFEAIDSTERHVRTLSAGTLVLPILYASDDEEVRKVERQYACVAKSDARQRSFLGVLDDAMAMRLKGQPMNCHWSK